MKITLEPGGPFPPSPIVAANIRAALEAGRVVMSDTPPTVQAGDSVTAWLDTTTGHVKIYVGNAAPVIFRPQSVVVSDMPPPDPVLGTQWFRTTNGGLYTWFSDAWVSVEGTLPFGLDDLLTAFRSGLVSATAPINPTLGTQWFRTLDGCIYTWYGDYWIRGSPVANTVDETVLEFPEGAYGGQQVTLNGVAWEWRPEVPAWVALYNMDDYIADQVVGVLEMNVNEARAALQLPPVDEDTGITVFDTPLFVLDGGEI